MSLNALKTKTLELYDNFIKQLRKPRKRVVRLARVPIEDLEIRCFLSASMGLATVFQPDGKAIVVGSAEDLTNGNRDFAISRLNTDGTLDTTFNGDGRALVPFNLLGAAGGDDVATSVALQQDGKIVVGGYAQASENGDYDFAVVRLNFDGSPDLTFGNGAKVTVGFQLGGSLDDRASGVAVADDGKIILGGTAQRTFFGDTDFAIARLTSEGTLDTTFSSDGLKIVPFNSGGDRTDVAQAVAVQPNGAIVIAGGAQRSRSGDYDFAIARVTADGGMDKSFAGTGKRTVPFNRGDDEATSVTLQGTDILMGGYVQNSSDGSYDIAAVRLKSSGNLDRSFGIRGKQTAGFDLGGFNDDAGFAVTTQADGRVIVAGRAQLTDTGNYDFAVVRLTPNGSLDPAFGNNGTVRVPIDLIADGLDEANGVAVNPLTGSILLAGSASTDDQGHSDVAVAQLTSLGMLDNLFSLDGLTTFSFGEPLPPV